MQRRLSMAGPRHNGRALFFALAACVLIFDAWIMHRPPSGFASATGVVPEWPVLIDALVTIPLLYLLLVARKGWRAWRGALAAAMAALALSAWFVPAQSRDWLAALMPVRYLVMAVVVVADCAAIVGVMAWVRRARRDGAHVESAIAAAMLGRFGDSAITRLLVLEARMWFYALFASGRRPTQFPGEAHFSTHAKDGNASNQLGFIMLILFELPIAHVLLALLWSAQAAWIASLLTLWGLAFLVAEYRASLLRPISLEGDTLVIRYGVLVDLRVPLRDIARVQAAQTAVPRRQPGSLRCCEAGVPNVRIDLARPLDLPTLGGRGRSIERIHLGMDQPASFITRLQSRLGSVAGH